MTPVHFPLVHNSFFGMKSYLDEPSVEYRRLKGLRNVEEGDIVVFNFPAGDTVASKFEETPLYYDLLVKQYGRDQIKADKATFGEIIYRPVDRRQNFVKRAVALPGQRLKIVNDTIYIDGEVREFPENVQFNYVFATSRPLDDTDLRELGIAQVDISMIEPMTPARVNLQPFLENAPHTSYAYMAPLTRQMIESMENSGLMVDKVKYNDIAHNFAGEGMNSYAFPFYEQGDWTLSNYGGNDGLLIPRKGMTIELTPENWTTYERCIRNYENHPEAYFDRMECKAYIGGKPADTYTFGMDYYFMMGDNRDNSQDSRFWGFVPEDHVVGTPMIVLASFDNERGLFDGKIRWNRILRDANPDK